MTQPEDGYQGPVSDETAAPEAAPTAEVSDAERLAQAFEAVAPYMHELVDRTIKDQAAKARAGEVDPDEVDTNDDEEFEPLEAAAFIEDKMYHTIDDEKDAADAEEDADDEDVEGDASGVKMANGAAQRTEDADAEAAADEVSTTAAN